VISQVWFRSVNKIHTRRESRNTITEEPLKMIWRIYHTSMSTWNAIPRLAGPPVALCPSQPSSWVSNLFGKLYLLVELAARISNTLSHRSSASVNVDPSGSFDRWVRWGTNEHPTTRFNVNDSTTTVGLILPLDGVPIIL
jgi:hypothetical protein